METVQHNPSMSKAIMIAHVQNGLLAIGIIFGIMAASSTFYDNKPPYAFLYFIAMVLAGLMTPINLVGGSYYLLVSRRRYSRWGTYYMLASLVISLLVLMALGGIANGVI